MEADKSRYYLYRFKLLLEKLKVEGIREGALNLKWRSQHVEQIYDAVPVSMKDGELKIGTLIEMEEILAKEGAEESLLPAEVLAS